MTTAHRDHCPHGMPSKSSCVECMDESGVADPSLDPTGRPERGRQIAITGYEPDPPGPLIVRVGPNPPCPACNDYGVLSTLDGDTIGPCPECAP